MHVVFNVSFYTSGRQFSTVCRRNRAGSSAAGRRCVAVFLPRGRVRQLQGHLDGRSLRIPAQSAAGAECQRNGTPRRAVVSGRSDQRPDRGAREVTSVEDIARRQLGMVVTDKWSLAPDVVGVRLLPAHGERRLNRLPGPVCGCAAGGRQTTPVLHRQRPAGGDRHDRTACAACRGRRLHLMGLRCAESG